MSLFRGATLAIFALLMRGGDVRAPDSRPSKPNGP
jgi:hypothetical protein